jgi:hypothetical protein
MWVAVMLATAAQPSSVDCGNGNQCPTGQTCAGLRSNFNSTVMVGQQYGCTAVSLGDNAINCPGSRFACPSETTCNNTQAGFECRRDDHTIAQNASLNTDSSLTSNMISLLQHGRMTGEGLGSSGRAGNSGMCEYIGSSLPSECSCQDDNLFGGTIDCTEYIMGDTIGVRAAVSPCGTPSARMSLTIYETSVGFSYTIAGISAGTSESEPIPGLSYDIPDVGSAGAEAIITIEGNAAALTVDVSLDACISIFGEQECGGDLS